MIDMSIFPEISRTFHYFKIFNEWELGIFISIFVSSVIAISISLVMYYSLLCCFLMSISYIIPLVIIYLLRILYWRIKKFVPIDVVNKIYIFSSPETGKTINTSSLHLNENGTTLYSLKLKIMDYAKEKIKEGNMYYTLVIDKSTDIKIVPNMNLSDNDGYSERINTRYFYLYRLYDTSSDFLKFDLELTIKNNNEGEPSLKIYLEYGKINERFDKANSNHEDTKLRNLITEEKVFHAMLKNL